MTLPVIWLQRIVIRKNPSLESPWGMPYSPRLALRVGEGQMWVKGLVQEHSIITPRSPLSFSSHGIYVKPTGYTEDLQRIQDIKFNLSECRCMYLCLGTIF